MVDLLWQLFEIILSGWLAILLLVMVIAFLAVMIEAIVDHMHAKGIERKAPIIVTTADSSSGPRKDFLPHWCECRRRRTTSDGRCGACGGV